MTTAPTAKMKSSGRGGRREGAGRKHKPNKKSERLSLVLNPATNDLVEEWKEKYSCSSSSEAVRQMILAAAVSRRLVKREDIVEDD